MPRKYSLINLKDEYLTGRRHEYQTNWSYSCSSIFTFTYRKKFILCPDDEEITLTHVSTEKLSASNPQIKYLKNGELIPMMIQKRTRYHTCTSGHLNGAHHLRSSQNITHNLSHLSQIMSQSMTDSMTKSTQKVVYRHNLKSKHGQVLLKTFVDGNIVMESNWICKWDYEAYFDIELDSRVKFVETEVSQFVD